MNITVLGGSGQVGQVVVEQALQRGYNVCVVVRDKNKLGSSIKSSVKVIEGDLRDQNTYSDALSRCDAVINAAGGSKGSDQRTIFEQITRTLTDQMAEHGVKRLVSINGSTTFMPNEAPDRMRRIMAKTFVRWFFAHMRDAKQGEMSVLLKRRQIDWVSVRATMLTKEGATGRVKADDRRFPGAKVSLPDLANFMLDQAKDSQWIHRAPMVASM